MSALYHKILPTPPDNMIAIEMDRLTVNPDSHSAEASAYNSFENLSKDSEDYQKIMEESINQFGWNLKDFEAAVDNGGDPFQCCENSKENCYQKLLKKEILIKTDYEYALEYKEMCIDWIGQNPEEHLEKIINLLSNKFTTEFRKEQIEKLKKIFRTDHYDIFDVLQNLLEEAFEANDRDIYLMALANGADILLKDSFTNESVFDGIIDKVKERYEYFKESYYFVFRHEQFSKNEVVAIINLAYQNEDPDIFVEMSNYMFLAAVSNSLPLKVAKFIEIARNFGQFKALQKSLEESVFLSYSDSFYDKLFSNDKLKNAAKLRIVESIFEQPKSNIEELLRHRDNMKKISLNIDKRLELKFILKNNIQWNEDAAFKKRFRKFFQKNSHQINVDENVKYDYIDLVTSAIYYNNIEALKVILNKAFQSCAHTKKELGDAYFRNQNLIGLNELITVKFLYDENEMIFLYDCFVLKNDFTLLSYAINKDNKLAISELLKRGAHLMVNDSYYRSNVIYFEKHPHILEKHLDNCLIWYDEYLDRGEQSKFLYFQNNAQLLDESYNLLFDEQCILLNFKNFIPSDEFDHKNEKMFDVILDLAKSGHLNYLLKHPLIASLIFLKWNSLSKIFLINFLTIIIFFISFVYYNMFKLNFIDNNIKFYAILYTISFIIVIVLLIFFILRELFQFYLMKWSYFTHVINWLEILLILLIILTFPIFDFNKETVKGFASLAILFSAMELSIVIRSASLSFLSVYVMIFEQVIKTYLKISILFGIYIASFSFCFMILFGHEVNKDTIDGSGNGYDSTVDNNDEKPTASNKNDNDLKGLEFGTYVPTALKTLVMFAGEYDSNAIMFHSQYYWGYLIFFIFVCSMALVAVNLLHGLAVSDVQDIKNKAELNNLIFKVSMLPKYEETREKLSKTNFLNKTNFYVDYFVNSRILINDDRTVKLVEVDNGNKYSNKNFKYCFGLKELRISKDIVNQIKQILRNLKTECKSKPIDLIRAN